MTEVIQFALLGLGAGAVYALLAQGIVLIYRGSGVINLSHGALAMTAAYVAHFLDVESGWPLIPAAIGGIAVVTAIGMLTDQLVMRRLRTAPGLARLIATVGLLIVLQSLVVLIWGSTPVIVLPPFGTAHVEILGATASADRLVMLGAALVLTAGLWLTWRFSRAGWITEAVSENQRVAAGLGWSPNLVSLSTWGVGSALAGLAGVLVAPITQLDPVVLPLTVIPALAAALIGGFRSFPLTLAGGLALGVGQAEVGNYVHVSGAADALPLAVILAVLVVGGSALPLRGQLIERLPSIGSGQISWRLVVPLTVAGVLVLSLVTSQDWLTALAATCAVAIVLLSLVVLIGYAGQLSLGQYALAGIGALVAARLVAGPGWAFLPALVAGVLAAALIGFLFALPALRTRGVNLAVVTLALGVAAQSLIFSNPTFVGDFSGIRVGDPDLFGWSISPIEHPNRYACVCFAALVLALIAIANLRRGAAGRRLLAVRSNERAAAAYGISPAGAKLSAFALSGALAGLGGILLAFQASTVTFGAFVPLNSLNAVAQAVIGGIGYLAGPLVGSTLNSASLASVISLSWESVSEYLPLLGGVGVLVTLLVHPQGVASKHPFGALSERFARRGPELPAAGEAKPVTVPPQGLRVEDLVVRYGGVTAVDGVSLRVEPGEIVGLIGPNGAGKTSLMDAVTGYAKYAGSVSLGGASLDGMAAHQRARAGLARSFQHLELFNDLSVLENVQAVSDGHRGLALAADLLRPRRVELPPAAIAAIREFGFAGDLGRLPDELPYGRRRLLAIARAVAMEPSVLLLDEPVAGLDDRESAEFAHLVRRLAREWGMAVLVIEHDMNFVMEISDRIQVIDFGKPVTVGSPDKVRRSPEAIAAYLGAEEPEAAAAAGGKPVVAG